MEKDGFRLNFGAHAVYGRDRSYLNDILTSLGIKLPWAGLDPTKVRYELHNGELTPPPINIQGILQSRLLPQIPDKLSFIRAVFSIISNTSLSDQFRTYLLKHQAEVISKEAVTKLMFEGNQIIGVGTYLGCV